MLKQDTGSVLVGEQRPIHSHAGRDPFDVPERQMPRRRRTLLDGGPPRRPTSDESCHLEDEAIRPTFQDTTPSVGSVQRRPAFHVRRNSENRVGRGADHRNVSGLHPSEKETCQIGWREDAGGREDVSGNTEQLAGQLGATIQPPHEQGCELPMKG